MRQITALILAGVVGASCTGDHATHEGNATSDSSGVRIVENYTPRLDEGSWSLSETPTLRLGADSIPLVRVRGAVRLGNGTIVVGNGGFQQLNYYDPDGSLQTRAGGSGNGPGEFGGPFGLSNIWKIGRDTVATWEHGNTRLSLFDDDGEFLSVQRMQPASGRVPQVQGIIGRNQVVGYHMSNRMADRAGALHRDSIQFVSYDSRSETWQEMRWLPGIESFVSEFTGRLILGPVPFGRRPVVGTGRERVFYGAGDEFVVDIYTVTGQLENSIRRIERNRALHPEDIEADKTRRMEGAPPDPEMRAEWQRAVDNAPYPDSVPAYRRFVIDDVDNLWVQEYTRPTDSIGLWSVFDDAGEWLTDVSMPASLQVLSIGADYLLGVERDALDVENVVMYDIHKTP